MKESKNSGRKNQFKPLRSLNRTNLNILLNEFALSDSALTVKQPFFSA